MNIAIISPFNPSFVKDEFIQDTVPNINGNATAVNILVKALIEQGNKVYIYTTISKGLNQLSFSGKNIEIRVISKEFHPKGMSKIRVVGRLKKAIERDIDKLDVIHAHWTYEYAAAARNFEDRLPVLCTIRDWCPYQSSLAEGITEKYSWWINRLLFSYVMKSTKIKFIANSLYTYDKAHRDYSDKDITIIPNPVQHEYIITEKKERNRSSIFITICQSPEEKRKNIDVLLKAFNIYRKEKPESVLILVGAITNEWKDSHKKYLTGVVLTGAIDHEDVYKYLDQADILVHPSIEETFGNILLEAMARRVVCIGGEHAGAVPEVLGYGERGFICDVTDIECLKKTMIDATNELLTEKMINNATQYLNEKYSDISVAKMHLSIYKDCINKK